MRGTKQSISVLFQPEDRGARGGFVGAHTLKHTEPVMKGMGQHMNPRLLPGHHFAVKPDMAGEL